jgi:hypothetical protein
MPETRAIVLESIAIKPRSFLELVDLTLETSPSLRSLLESLMAEGLVGKTSNGFETLYYLQHKQARPAKTPPPMMGDGEPNGPLAPASLDS